MSALVPVYEFRPLPGEFRSGAEVRRFADGQWLADDGEHDLAFIADGLCLMVEPSYQRNITWSWLTTRWTGFQAKHPNGNPWHYALREGETKWGGDWGRDNHPNAKAGRAGMSKMCSERGAASGVHVEFHLNDRHIKAGLVRERDTKKLLTFPDKPLCMYCGHDWVEQGEPRP